MLKMQKIPNLLLLVSRDDQLAYFTMPTLKEPVISTIFVPLSKNVMEQNPVGFPNSICLHVGPYSPYFCVSYDGIGSAHVLWPLMFDHVTKIMAPPHSILGVAQVGIVANHGEPLDEDDDFSKSKHNPRMP
jgi:hypothetical protein